MYIQLWHIVKHSSHPVSLLTRYFISGLSVGIIYVLLGYVLSNDFGVSMPVSVTLAYIATTPLAFTLQKRFTFKSNRSMRRELPRFITVGILILISAKLANQFVKLPVPLMVQLCIFWVLGSVLNFLAYKFWVFTHDESSYKKRS